MLACASGVPEKGLAVFAPETAKAITPYHVSPVSAVVMEMLSDERAEWDMAHQVWMNWIPPMLSCDSLWINVKPAESLTEKAVPDGQQSHATIITSFDWVVVSGTLQAVTYPHPVEAEPSKVGFEEVCAFTNGRPTTMIDKTVLTSKILIATARYLVYTPCFLKAIFLDLCDRIRRNGALVFSLRVRFQHLRILKSDFVCIIVEFTFSSQKT
jgi:hypothetical protein